MIPKVIHYCWFGHNSLDEGAKRCIASWRKFFPDHKIIQWNEDNFDISKNPFMQQAYEAKKWAFVSDVARLVIVYEHGGIYFDTDVEVIRSFDDILSTDAKGFMGFEKSLQVASGLGFGAEAGAEFLRANLALYRNLDFNAYLDNLGQIACPVLTTDYLLKNGLKLADSLQRVCDFDIYPSEFFSPLNYQTGYLKNTSNTHSIHWYSASWQSQYQKKERDKLRLFRRCLGKYFGDVAYGILSSVKQEGLCNYLLKRVTRVLSR